MSTYLLKTFIAKIGTDETAPKTLPVFPDGEFQTEDEMTFFVDEKAAASVIAAFEKYGNDLVVDYEHQTLKDVKAPAAGWITAMTYVPGVGIVASIDWTNEAKEYIEKREYKYFSPVFQYDKKSGRVMKLEHVGLTNWPKTRNMTAILAKMNANNEEDVMDLLQQLIGVLGLAADTTEDVVVAALKAHLSDQAEVAKAMGLDEQTDTKTMIAKATELMQKPKDGAGVVPTEVLKALDMEKADVSTTVASIHALKQGADNAPGLATEVANLQAWKAEKEATEAVTAAMAAGKIAPAQKEWASAYAKSDLNGFNTFVAKAPVVVPVTDLPGKTVETGGSSAAIDDTQLAINKQLGVSNEDWKAYGPGSTAE